MQGSALRYALLVIVLAVVGYGIYWLKRRTDKRLEEDTEAILKTVPPPAKK